MPPANLNCLLLSRPGVTVMSQPAADPTNPSYVNAPAKPKRQYRTADQWREIVEAFQCNSLTRTEFCKQHGIAASGLYNWQRKFEQQGIQERNDGNAFVEIRPPVVPAEKPNQTWDVELELGQGRVLRLRMA